MKRLLWCLCLCSLCPILITGCGDDDGGGGSEDGGVTPADLDEVNGRITDLDDRLGDLTDDVDGLGGQLDGLSGDLSDLSEEVRRRLNALEDPDLISCSEEERCIPNGIELTRTGLADIISIVCEHEVDCCSSAELNLKFGPGIKTAAQCVSLFTDIVNNGFSPSFLQESPYIVNQIIRVAQALNDTRVRVALNPEGIEACVDSLRDRDCPRYLEPGEPGEPECTAYDPAMDEPCMLSNLLTGLQEEGELCGQYGGGYHGYSIPECGEGLYCSWAGASQSGEGICARLPEEGHGCQTDYDCDPLADEGYSLFGTRLYCNVQDAKCAPLGDVGDPCAYIVDDFSIWHGSLWPWSRSSTSQDCLPWLACDPISTTCVAQCSEGYLCDAHVDPFNNCGAGRVCNVTEFPDLNSNYSLGVCTGALAVGATCTLGTECASGSCSDACDPETGTCKCGAPLKAAGAACPTPGPDALCSSGLCGTDGKCAAFCDCDDAIDEYACNLVAQQRGRDGVSCGAGTYCDFSEYVTDEALGFGYACKPLIANGNACDLSFYMHRSCTSGFCDPDPGDDQTGPTYICSPKQAANGNCTSTFDEECPNNQYCNNDNACRPYVPLNGDCDLTDPAGRECAAGLVCVDGTTDTCRAYAESGENCNDSHQGAPSCAPNKSLTCIDVDGPTGPGTMFKCYNLNGGVDNGVDCAGVDARCKSGFCLPNGPSPTAYQCAPPLEEGDDCDTANITIDTCAKGLFCNHPNGSTAGKCAPQRRPGESCKPYFNGRDCTNGGLSSCVFTKDQFLCNMSAQPVETLFCDGN